jgi:hypothetical protein
VELILFFLLPGHHVFFFKSQADDKKEKMSTPVTVKEGVVTRGL